MLIVHIFQLCLNNCFYFGFIFLAFFSALASLLLLRLEEKLAIFRALQQILFIKVLLVFFKTKLVRSLSVSWLGFLSDDIFDYFFLHNNLLHDILLNLFDNFLLDINRDLDNFFYSPSPGIIGDIHLT